MIEGKMGNECSKTLKMHVVTSEGSPVARCNILSSLMKVTACR